MKGIDNLLFIFEEGFKDSLKKRMNLLQIVLNESEKICQASCPESETARVDRYDSGVSSSLNSTKSLSRISLLVKCMRKVRTIKTFIA